MGRKFQVYALIDPRTHSAFYIGMSEDARRRFGSHRSDWWSPANPRIRCIRRAGLEPKMGILAEFTNFSEAALYEARAIKRVPGLDNYAQRGVGAKFVCVCKAVGVGECDGKAAGAEYLRYYHRGQALAAAKAEAAKKTKGPLAPETRRDDDDAVH